MRKVLALGPRVHKLPSATRFINYRGKAYFAFSILIISYGATTEANLKKILWIVGSIGTVGAMAVNFVPNGINIEESVIIQSTAWSLGYGYSAIKEKKGFWHFIGKILKGTITGATYGVVGYEYAQLDWKIRAAVFTTTVIIQAPREGGIKNFFSPPKGDPPHHLVTGAMTSLIIGGGLNWVGKEIDGNKGDLIQDVGNFFNILGATAEIDDACQHIVLQTINRQSYSPMHDAYWWMYQNNVFPVKQTVNGWTRIAGKKRAQETDNPTK